MTTGDISAASERIDMTRPHSSRVWDYWLGGKDNFEVDRELGEQIAGMFPHVVATARGDREFMHRSTRFLAAEAGIDQFLDIGTGLPTPPNVHQVAQEVTPEARVVYVDNDPIVLVHARALLTSTSEGSCDYLDADMREPGHILREARKTLDFDRPVAIMLMSVLHFVADIEDVVAILGRLLAAVPSGSYLALTHTTDEIGGPAVKTAFEMWNATAHPKSQPRTRSEVITLFDGLELLDPGVVSPPLWRPRLDLETAPEEVPLWAGVARKP
ncbi:SAM-dependent methyltransferase [Spirillospora sp. NPDC048911]|uniref:SAM-dependent methyltransferase n=1 Tax=Spirillospora sp. NPDC048911 TaxID=3364527 RepID=UPI0037246E55